MRKNSVKVISLACLLVAVTPQGAFSSQDEQPQERMSLKRAMDEVKSPPVVQEPKRIKVDVLPEVNTALLIPINHVTTSSIQDIPGVLIEYMHPMFDCDLFFKISMLSKANQKMVQDMYVRKLKQNDYVPWERTALTPMVLYTLNERVLDLLCLSDLNARIPFQGLDYVRLARLQDRILKCKQLPEDHIVKLYTSFVEVINRSKLNTRGISQKLLREYQQESEGRGRKFLQSMKKIKERSPQGYDNEYTLLTHNNLSVGDVEDFYRDDCPEPLENLKGIGKKYRDWIEDAFANRTQLSNLLTTDKKENPEEWQRLRDEYLRSTIKLRGCTFIQILRVAQAMFCKDKFYIPLHLKGREFLLNLGPLRLNEETRKQVLTLYENLFLAFSEKYDYVFCAQLAHELEGFIPLNMWDLDNFSYNFSFQLNVKNYVNYIRIFDAYLLVQNGKELGGKEFLGALQAALNMNNLKKYDELIKILDKRTVYFDEADGTDFEKVFSLLTNKFGENSKRYIDLYNKAKEFHKVYDRVAEPGQG